MVRRIVRRALLTGRFRRRRRSHVEIVRLLLLLTWWNDAEIVVVVSNDDREEAVDAGMRPERMDLRRSEEESVSLVETQLDLSGSGRWGRGGRGRGGAEATAAIRGG